MSDKQKYPYIDYSVIKELDEAVETLIVKRILRNPKIKHDVSLDKLSAAKADIVRKLTNAIW